MAGRDLRALFGTNTVEFDVVHVFADRDDERNAFDRAGESHRQAVAPGRCDPQDLTGLHLLGAAAVARAGSSIATFLRDKSR